MAKLHNIFINDNLTPTNNKIAFHFQKLKFNGRIDKKYSRNGIVQIVSKNIEIEKKIKIMPMNKLRGSFPDFDSGEDA